ncbi:heterokaryon incompatibility protein-domain-containing protein [Xylariales sp. AK1849]|nr:heterokaryon incompatibility protein-domain-containing protein [Xylariales sp. AK1849]
MRPLVIVNVPASVLPEKECVTLEEANEHFPSKKPTLRHFRRPAFTTPPKTFAMESQVPHDIRHIIYRKLNHSKPEIRLLELQPAQDIEDRVVCRLINVTLTDNLEFLAISSLVGEPGDNEDIYVNGRRVTIPATLGQVLRHVRAVFLTPSGSEDPQPPVPPPAKAPNLLAHALRHVRSILPDAHKTRSHEGRTIRLWLDALCIDRRDAQERSEQLVHMAMVYRSAKMVIGWLGMTGELSDLCVETMRQIEDAFPPDFGKPRDKEQHPEDYAPHHQWMAKIAHIWTDVNEEQYYPALLDFVERPYFNRSWILDEMALARYPVFLVGDKIVPWRQVLLLNRLMEELRDHDSPIPNKRRGQATQWRPVSYLEISKIRKSTFFYSTALLTGHNNEDTEFNHDPDYNPNEDEDRR